MTKYTLRKALKTVHSQWRKKTAVKVARLPGFSGCQLIVDSLFLIQCGGLAVFKLFKI